MSVHKLVKVVSTPATYGIHRHQDRNAWLVFMRRNRKVFQQRFTDSVFGGKAKALTAAKAWRDAVVAEHQPISKRARSEIVSSANTSGVPGVTLWKGSDAGPMHWRARTMWNGRELSRVFSVSRYGYDGAFVLAVNERERQLQAIHER